VLSPRVMLANASIQDTTTQPESETTRSGSPGF
jgi:hypothetical protein